MRMRRVQLLAFALLCLYAAAGIHQFMPHHADHGTGEACFLCVLFAGLLIAVPYVVLTFLLDCCILIPSLSSRSSSPRSWRSLTLRAPPES